ncbi:MAG: alpha-amylase family glycosyl hydrolase [Bacteroidales bacterium]
MSPDSSSWWRHAVIYQIYPRSFMDGNGDGIGDLRGIRSRLDYLKWLGIDTLWLSPIYPSPQADFGYDVSDYTAVDPIYGTMADFDGLVGDMHARGMRILLDFVPNHTSDRHPWFLESRLSRENPKRGWYIWRDAAADGGPPNNWLSNFGGSAWQWDEHTRQYYYHAFLPEQPDLNWRNPDVEAAMSDVLRFWLARGVDGFRVDVLWHLMKDDQLRDNPPNPAWHPGISPYYSLVPTFSADRPEIHDLVMRLRRVLSAYGERLMLGEIYLPIERLVSYYGPQGPSPHVPFNFQLIQLPWTATAIGAAIDAYERALPPGASPAWVLGNHDKPRVARRLGAAQARVAAMLLLTLRGTPTIYNGDEIGLVGVIRAPEHSLDPKGRNLPGLGRDAERTPMQWDDGEHAGFTTGVPWLPVQPDFRHVNVAAQRADPSSTLSLYRALLRLRRDDPVMGDGEYVPADFNDQVVSFTREQDGERRFVALNFSHVPQRVRLAGGAGGHVVLSTHLDRAEPVWRELTLRPDEGVVVGVEDRRLARRS